MWIGDPCGKQNCHFLEIIDNDVGPHGITIDPDKIFDDEAQWRYLEGMLHEKVDTEIAGSVKFAHHRLPELFKQTKKDLRITYPFKYDCISGIFLYPEIELNLRKKLTAGNRKARATGFAIPALPKNSLMSTYSNASYKWLCNFWIQELNVP
jgi:hypothetical protein